MGNDISYKSCTSLRVNTPACTGCGLCMFVCPQGVLSASNGKAIIADPDSCTECGACAESCPLGAIKVMPQKMGWRVKKRPVRNRPGLTEHN